MTAYPNTPIDDDFVFWNAPTSEWLLQEEKIVDGGVGEPCSPPFRWDGHVYQFFLSQKTTTDMIDLRLLPLSGGPFAVVGSRNNTPYTYREIYNWTYDDAMEEWTPEPLSGWYIAPPETFQALQAIGLPTTILNARINETKVNTWDSESWPAPAGYNTFRDIWYPWARPPDAAEYNYTSYKTISCRYLVGRYKRQVNGIIPILASVMLLGFSTALGGVLGGVSPPRLPRK